MAPFLPEVFSPEDRGASTAARSQRWTYVLLVVVIGLGSIDGARMWTDGAGHIGLPYPTGVTELYIADGIGAVARGEPIYPPLDSLPFVVRVYNPLTYLPGGLLARLFTDDFDGLLIAGRVLPFASGLAFLLLAGVWSQRRFGRSTLTVFLPVLLMVMHSSTMTDFFRNRPEMPGLLLIFAGWFAFDLRLRRWPVVSALCFAGAFAFKQSFIAAPAAVSLLLLIERDARMVATFGGTLLASVLVVVLGAWLTLGDGYFDHTFFLLAANPVHPLRASASFYPILIRDHWQLIFPGAVVALVWLLAAGRERPLCVYLGLCLAWTSWSHGKFGADLNYHGELSILLALVIVTATHRMLEQGSRWAPLPVAAVLAFLVFGTLTHGVGWNRVCLNRIRPTPHCEPGPPATGDVRPTSEALRTRGANLLILQPEIALRTGRVVALDTALLTLLFEQGRLDLELVLGPVRARRHTTIVLPLHPTGYLRQVAAVAEAAGYRSVHRSRSHIELRR